MRAQASRRADRHEPCDPTSIERGIRQHLADKVTGNLAGIWLLLAEHLRLKTWDLLCHWTQQPSERVDPRLALQLVHEAALCSNGVRANRTLRSRGGFELSNGLPFVASDATMHFMLAVSAGAPQGMPRQIWNMGGSSIRPSLCICFANHR